MKCRMLFCAVLFGVFAFGGANPSPSQKKDEPPKKAADGDDLAKLGKTRLETAEKACKTWAQLERGSGTFLGLDYQLSVRLLHAELDLATNKQKRIDAHVAHLQRMKAWEKDWAPDRHKEIVAIIQSAQAEAAYWLAKERAGKN